MRRSLAHALWIVAALAACRSEQEIGYDEGYADGRNEGAEHGYAEGREAGFRSGRAVGLEKGYRDGLATGRTEAVGRWAPVGFGLGGLLGLGLVLVIRRRDLLAALQRRRVLGRLERYRMDAGDLQPEAAARLDGLLARVAALESVLPSEQVAPLARTAAELVQLQSRLDAAQAAVPAPDPQRLEELERFRDRSQGAEREAAEDTLGAIRRAQSAYARSQAHGRQVSLKLEALESVLDHLRVGAANVEAVGRDALAERMRGEVAQAVDDLERAVATSRRELAEL
ncbi:MAG: hypothetical protein KC613_02160 [Myxococcales bacterium]|nr:hypothetical protein [Myxococcales bacterium]